MSKKKVVFVRGGKTTPERPWNYFHFHPNKEINIGPVDLIYFDYMEGQRSTLKNWIPKRGDQAPATTGHVLLEPVVNIRLETMELGAKKPSILALYEWIKKQPKNSIISFQYFGHGWDQAPITWYDCWEDSDPGDLSDSRDSHDTEMRPRDFFGSNPLAGSEGKKFANAFDPRCFVKLWGCTARSETIKKVSNYNKAAAGLAGNAARKKAVEEYLQIMELSWQFQLAKQLNISSWVAPYGWGTNGYDKEVSSLRKFSRDTPKPQRHFKYKGTFPPKLKNGELWWRVSTYFRNQPRNVRFYQNVLRAELDKTYYFKMSRTFINHVQDLIK